jgi:hypothetical protein
MSLKETGRAGGSLQARSDDQLSSSISSVLTASAQKTQAENANQVLKFHPLADMFPLMEGAEFDALVADIKKNGLCEAVILYDGMILDGRNRYRACLAADVSPAPIDATRWIDDPDVYVISKNIHRRHLTVEQKRELIAKLIKAQPEKSDRQVATIAKVSPTTVGTVRAKLEKTGDVSKLDTRLDTKGRKQPVTKVNLRLKHKAARKKWLQEERRKMHALETNTEDSFLDDNGDFAPVDPAADAACRIRGFLYRAQQSAFGARADNLAGLTITREMQDAAAETAKAWTDLARRLGILDEVLA